MVNSRWERGETDNPTRQEPCPDLGWGTKKDPTGGNRSGREGEAMTDNSVPPGEGSVNALEEQLRTVALRRDIYSISKGIMDNRRHAFDVANADTIREVEVARTEMASAEMETRLLAVQIYAETGSKQPHAGVGIRVTTKLAYSRAAALEWAQHHRIALALDTKAFEGLAKASPNTFPIVTFTQEPTATIAADLTTALGIQPVAEGGSE